MTETWITLAFVIATAWWDAMTTMWGLERGLRELNPIMAWLFKRMEPADAVLITKGGLILACVAAAIVYGHEWYIPVGFGILGVIQAIVVLRNLRALR